MPNRCIFKSKCRSFYENFANKYIVNSFLKIWIFFLYSKIRYINKFWYLYDFRNIQVTKDIDNTNYQVNQYMITCNERGRSNSFSST